MSTGETSSLIRRAHALTGQPDQPVKKPVAQKEKEPLKPMTGAQLAFRPSAPPRQPGGTGSFAPLKPGAAQGKPQTGQQPAFKPQTGQQPDQDLRPRRRCHERRAWRPVGGGRDVAKRRQLAGQGQPRP
jgi:hypothetical protein